MIGGDCSGLEWKGCGGGIFFKNILVYRPSLKVNELYLVWHWICRNPPVVSELMGDFKVLRFHLCIPKIMKGDGHIISSLWCQGSSVGNIKVKNLCVKKVVSF